LVEISIISFCYIFFLIFCFVAAGSTAPHTVVVTSDERSAMAVYQAAKIVGVALPKGVLTPEVWANII
jgi:hypothetical protein